MVSSRITRIRADWVPGTERGLDIRLGDGANILIRGKEESFLLDLFRWGLSGRTSASDDPPRSVLKWMWDLNRDLNIEVDITTEEGAFSFYRYGRTYGPSVDERTSYRRDSYVDAGTHCFRRGEWGVARGDTRSGKLTTASELEFVFGTADPELLAVRATDTRDLSGRIDEATMAKLRNLAEARKRHHVFGPLMLNRAERFLEPLESSIAALRELVGETQLLLIMDPRWKEIIELKNDAGSEVVYL